MSHSNPTISSTLIATGSTANALSIGDIINGPGIPIDSEVLNINYISSGQWEIMIDQIPVEADVYSVGNHVSYLDPSGANSGLVQWQTNIVITPTGEEVNNTLSFREDVKGWVSFKSFTDMEFGLSMANDYYTFKNGYIYQHDQEDVDRNTFYAIDSNNPLPEDFTPSSVSVLLNDNPSIIKMFNTLNYEGSQAKVDKFSFEDNLSIPLQPNTDYNDQEYYNLYAKYGWSVESIITDKEIGYVNEFVEKEGKWFNNINRLVDLSLQQADTSDFTFQGIGVTSQTSAPIFGCMDSSALNYNPLATIDDSSCVYDVTGCMDPTATNYNSLATIDDGSCVYCVDGCMDSMATNYDPLATCDDGSCMYIGAPIPGCTDMTANNYNPLADVDDGSCTYSPLIYGCTDPLATNYYAGATIDNGSCTYDVFGCTDPLSSNYNQNATIDDGSCIPVVSVASWRCNPDGGCTDPGDGSGPYSTLGACVAACSTESDSGY